MNIDDIDHNLNAAVERALGKRGTYLDAHVLAVALLRDRRVWDVTAAVAVAGWALFLVSLLT